LKSLFYDGRLLATNINLLKIQIANDVSWNGNLTLECRNELE